MKNILLITLFILSSCSPPSSFNDDIEKNNQQKEQKINTIVATDNVDEEIQKSIKKEIPEGLNAACREGCLYNYRIFKTIKEIRKSSLSLNKNQIENFKENCFLYCNKIFKDINIKIKKIKKEDKKDNTKKSDLTPFEEL